MAFKITNVEHLQRCRLWKGSMEQLEHSHGWLTLEKLQEKLRRLEACDDLTENELEYIAALKRTLGL
jgi:hypothetical protein